jgi:hypothetical protein
LSQYRVKDLLKSQKSFYASRTLELINYARVARVRVVRVVTEVFKK